MKSKKLEYVLLTLFYSVILFGIVTSLFNESSIAFLLAIIATALLIRPFYEFDKKDPPEE
ncbi:hypothetical protein EDM52_08730 [Brevibacillus invocatus]|uniref:Uncharacterized protein n=1 Tax=Brevibacillus invocatus TaxID=173959 RepID=A0A3M8CGH2_9BACL|nr:hypothetical protein [Brevibacillus invocatus]RNB74802.1 hypothetical protein EDM52_08730 [Brevibacillus invocatus]